MRHSIIEAPQNPSRQLVRKTPPRSKLLCLSRSSLCLLFPLVMSGCVYHHPPLPVQKSLVAFPKPAPHLLAEMPEPNCAIEAEAADATSNVVATNAEVAEVKTDTSDESETPDASAADAASPADAQTSTDTAALTEAVQRSERERDCFREAEARARAKLTELQSSVREMLKAVDKQKRKLASAR